ncbi:nucleotidyl transferase AbiEii/AbiGii toxin family protein, partial|uniref:nucleotidyl transferase AbiEii/AbiGii toxin family protein n=1 Tax=Escherichia coli TaxID=562 RepID=UPI0014440D3E
MTHYAILLEEQRAMLPALTPAREIGLTLYGGTAAALQLGHRQSVDFDFFTAKPLDEAELVAALPFLKDARLVQQGPDTLTVAVSPLGADKPPVKLSFFGNLHFGRVGEPKLTKNGELLVA